MKDWMKFLLGLLLLAVLFCLGMTLLIGLFFNPMKQQVTSPTQPDGVFQPPASQQPAEPAAEQPAPESKPVGVAPTEAFCQLGVTKMTPGVPTQSLSWDAVQLRGYMDDSLSTAIWTTTAYCRTVFPQQVTLLFDSIAANPVRVDGRVVAAGNGRIETGRVFEWVYPIPSRSNGHAYIVQP
jgi:hypothetical protein